jgi:hypothetical protein
VTSAVPSGPPPVSAAIGETIPLVREGVPVGSVSVRSFRAGEMTGMFLPPGARLMVLEAVYVADTRMAYSADDWMVQDTEGRRYPSLGADAPPDALASGRLRAGGSVAGNVAFVLQRGVTVESLVLTDGAGRDLVVVARASAP